jgi:hypothetical protein
MLTSEEVKKEVQVLPGAEGLSEERIAYLDKLVRQAKVASAVFTQFTQDDVSVSPHRPLASEAKVVVASRSRPLG